MTDYQLHHGVHRAADRDPLGRVLTWLWALGHLIVLTLLGVTAHDQLSSDHLGPVLTADHEPDCGFENFAAVDPGA
ncbi:hypothetical protein [Kitasatospora aureofaciens]|uniref:hypothetical protein n=1 Tax=Kitasatospora aureofaciens TaxID=1894 RepID=UPI001DCA5246|nr:hypothetical protein [Kitasatospora aureofaciens]HJD80237.1 hypothetical protein [Kitasatospora aureofaciens]